MQTSGKPYEGWMTAIPLSVFIVVVVVTLGGPTAFLNLVTLWAVDAATFVARGIRSW